MLLSMFVCSAITDPRPGHDFGNVKSFTFDYSYWSTSSVSLSNLSYYVVTTIVKRKHKRKQMQDKYNLHCGSKKRANFGGL